MEIFKFLSNIVLFVVSTGCIHCLFDYINLTFIHYKSEMNPPSQDEAVSSSIMKLIANAEKTSLEVQSQTNIIAHEILDISNKLTDKFGVNTSVCIRNIFRPSEKLILSFNSSAAECAQVLSYKIASAINNTSVTLIECKLDILKEGFTIIKNLRTNCNTVTTVTRNTIRGLENCSRIANRTIINKIFPALLAACKSKMAIDVEQEYSNWGSNITRIMSNTRMYLLNLKIKLASCKIIAATNAAKNASQIIADSAACLIKHRSHEINSL